MRPGTLIREATTAEAFEFGCPSGFAVAWFPADEFVPATLGTPCLPCSPRRHAEALAVLLSNRCGYCAEHCGGRRVEDGQVIEMRLVAMELNR